ncbi:hypothetical protein D3C80_1916520 [compost metagenome]
MAAARLNADFGSKNSTSSSSRSFTGFMARSMKTCWIGNWPGPGGLVPTRIAWVTRSGCSSSRVCVVKPPHDQPSMANVSSLMAVVKSLTKLAT